MINTKEICNEDNALQKQLLRGEISLKEFNERKQKSHKEYMEYEKDILANILKKYGGA